MYHDAAFWGCIALTCFTVVIIVLSVEAKKNYVAFVSVTFIVGLVLSLVSGSLFYQSGVVAGKAEIALSYSFENRIEFKVNDEFPIELLRLQRTGNYNFEAALTKILEQYVSDNPLVRYYEGEIVLGESEWIDTSYRKAEGDISATGFSAIWKTCPGDANFIDEICHLSCEIELNRSPTVQF